MRFVFCRARLPAFWKSPIPTITLDQGLCLGSDLLPPPLLPSLPPAGACGEGQGPAQGGRGGRRFLWPRAPCLSREGPSISLIRRATGGRAVFYGPIVCEILPIRERLSAQNIDFKTLPALGL